MAYSAGNLPDGIDAVKWLLNLLKRIRGEKGNAGLKIAIEKAFKYPESREQGCALASAIISELRRKSIEQAWETLNRIVNYPDGVRVKCALRRHGDGLGIKIPGKLLESYLGEEPCWVKIEVKGRTFYKADLR
ncbi:MAG: hypothetical protein FGF48_06810 [Candidatus Brockarchaeota archaeon]|nr:hypothetical protein [Candidatus Brockarchaeota archaeon]